MKEAILLFIGGAIGHITMLKILFWKPKFLYGNRGEVAAGTEIKEIPADIQPLVDKVVQSRIAREREKFADYDVLKQRVAEYENQNSAKQQQELESQKKYDESKQLYEVKIKNFNDSLIQKDNQIKDMQIGHSLTAEVFKQNGYAEETLALLKPSAVMEEGNVRIKLKNQDGNEETLSVEDGVKRFLANRPHLVKVNVKSGAGTPPAGNGNNGGNQSQSNDLVTLNQELSDALNSRDLKKVSEIKAKIQSALSSRGVSR